MKNIDLLFSENPFYDTRKLAVFNKAHMVKKRIVFKNKGRNFHPYYSNVRVFGDDTIKDIIAFVNSLILFYPIKIPVIFELGPVFVADKLVYTIFECICLFLVKKGYRLEVYMLYNNPDLWTEGIVTTALKKLNGKYEDSSLFISDFYSGSSDKHYRRIVPGDIDLESCYLGDLEAEVGEFLKNIMTGDGRGRFEHLGNNIDDISSVVGELVGNSCEHVKADVLIDIDVTSDYSVEGYKTLVEKYGLDDRYWYCGINIVVLNFSEKNIYNSIKEKIAFLKEENKSVPRYQRLLDAYEFHKKHFSDSYVENDFYCISAFQYKISGRKEANPTGGTGLANLIQNVEEKIGGMCYVMSGNSLIDFQKEVLDADEKHWVGFNKERDFFGKIPEKEVCLKSLVYFPGTAYNLTFLVKGDLKDEQD